jgi:hypothetical protein
MEKRFGFVAILDALGVSNYTVNEASKFILKKNLLLNELEEENESLTSYIKNHMPDVVPPKDQINFPKTTVCTFGDTIIICWSTENEHVTTFVAPGIFQWLQHAIVKGLRHGILLRGSVSLGEYLVDGDNTILGPAIADASLWSEQADWFGVILTPNCRLRMAQYFENSDLINTSNNPENWCVKYPVPLHEGIKDMMVVSWPQYFLETIEKEYLPGYAMVSHQLSKYSIPKGVESKFENTLQFFKWYEEKIYPTFVDDKSELKRIRKIKNKLKKIPKKTV